MEDKKKVLTRRDFLVSAGEPQPALPWPPAVSGFWHQRLKAPWWTFLSIPGQTTSTSR